MKILLIGFLALGSVSTFGQDAFNLGYDSNSLPQVVTCGTIHKLEADSSGSGDLILKFKNVRTGFLGDKLNKMKKETKRIQFTGSEHRDANMEAMVVKARLLGDLTMIKQVCISSELNELDSTITHHVTSAQRLEDALREQDEIMGTNTSL